MTYSPNHIQYLIQSMYGLKIAESKLMPLRGLLQEGKHDEYQKAAATVDPDRCLCELCHALTYHMGTRRCDACWELEKRILEPIRLKMWAATPGGQEVLEKLLQRLEEIGNNWKEKDVHSGD